MPPPACPPEPRRLSERPSSACGAVAEWSKALAWKVSIRQKRIEGSNPSRSATCSRSTGDAALPAPLDSDRPCALGPAIYRGREACHEHPRISGQGAAREEGRAGARGLRRDERGR